MVYNLVYYVAYVVPILVTFFINLTLCVTSLHLIFMMQTKTYGSLSMLMERNKDAYGFWWNIPYSPFPTRVVVT